MKKSFSHHFELDLNLPFQCWDHFGLPTPTLSQTDIISVETTSSVSSFGINLYKEN